jgi:hypothetical protein
MRIKRMQKQAKRYRRRIARQVRETRAERFGSQGAASGVRVVDPADYQLPAEKVVVERPPTKAFVETGRKWALEREADRVLKRTGVKRDAMLTRKDLSDRPRSTATTEAERLAARNESSNKRKRVGAIDSPARTKRRGPAVVRGVRS